MESALRYTIILMVSFPFCFFDEQLHFPMDHFMVHVWLSCGHNRACVEVPKDVST